MSRSLRHCDACFRPAMWAVEHQGCWAHLPAWLYCQDHIPEDVWTLPEAFRVRAVYHYR